MSQAQCKNGMMKLQMWSGSQIRTTILSKRNHFQEMAIQPLAKVLILRMAIASSVISLKWFGRNRTKLDVGLNSAAVDYQLVDHHTMLEFSLFVATLQQGMLLLHQIRQIMSRCHSHQDLSACHVHRVSARRWMMAFVPQMILRFVVQIQPVQSPSIALLIHHALLMWEQ
jgi:hypothetical protein